MNILLNIFGLLSRLAHAAPELVGDAVKVYHAAMNTATPSATEPPLGLFTRIAEAAPHLLDDAKDIYHAALVAPVPPAPEPVPPAPAPAS